MNWDATTDAGIEIIDSVTVKGYRMSTGWARDQRVYFASRFSRPFESVDIDTVPLMDGNGKTTGGKGIIATFNYKTTPGGQLVISTAISGVDENGALNNLIAEAPEDNFDKYLAETTKKWDKELGLIAVEGGTPDEQTSFYTALYHSMLAPTIYSDVDGRYFGPDKKIHNADG